MPENVPLDEDDVVGIGQEFAQLTRWKQALLFHRGIWGGATARRFTTVASDASPLIIGGADEQGTGRDDDGAR